jgi:hypothetical protein
MLPIKINATSKWQLWVHPQFHLFCALTIPNAAIETERRASTRGSIVSAPISESALADSHIALRTSSLVRSQQEQLVRPMIVQGVALKPNASTFAPVL